jgi:hypothetical protein
MNNFINHITEEINKHRDISKLAEPQKQGIRVQQPKGKSTIQKQNNNILFELIPSSKITENIYDYCVSGRYFNEVLSVVSRLKWDEIYHGYHYIYNHNSMHLLVGPEGKLSSYVPKVLKESFWTYNKLLDPAIIPNILTESLETNFRFKVHSKQPISIDCFPPSNKFHNREKIVYRNYVDKNVIMQFEIIRPMDCHKKFDELLYIKNDSKYMIKIHIKSTNDLGKYIRIFFPNDTDPQLTMQI